MDSDKKNLPEILDATVTDEMVFRLRDITSLDLAPDTPEAVHHYLMKQWCRQIASSAVRAQKAIQVRSKDVDECLKGAIDIHAHGGSDPFGRLMLEDEVAIDYSKAGMAAVVFKTWHTPSASRNQLLEKMMRQWEETPDGVGHKACKIFGGITLNQTVGGLNPLAVERCLKFPGFKYVWLPMVDSYFHQQVIDNWQDYQGIDLLDSNRKVKPELREIMQICAENNLVFASGHYPYRDSIVVMEEARKIGVKHCELIHPTHIHSKHTIEQMREQAQLGVKIMLCAQGFTCYPMHEEGPIYAVRIIDEVGEDHLVFGTDYGQVHNPPHIVGVRWAIQLLLAYGVSKESIKKIFCTNGREHLDLEPDTE